MRTTSVPHLLVGHVARALVPWAHCLPLLGCPAIGGRCCSELQLFAAQLEQLKCPPPPPGARRFDGRRRRRRCAEQTLASPLSPGHHPILHCNPMPSISIQEAAAVPADAAAPGRRLALSEAAEEQELWDCCVVGALGAALENSRVGAPPLAGDRQLRDPFRRFSESTAGGGPAGLSAALMLGRARRRVMVFDSGGKRNEASLVQHAVLGADGADRSAFLRTAREQVRARPASAAAALGADPAGRLPRTPCPAQPRTSTVHSPASRCWPTPPCTCAAWRSATLTCWPRRWSGPTAAAPTTAAAPAVSTPAPPPGGQPRHWHAGRQLQQCSGLRPARRPMQPPRLHPRPLPPRPAALTDGTKVTATERFVVRTEDGRRWRAKKVVLATGEGGGRAG